MRPNLARDGAACGDVDRDGGSGRTGQGGRQFLGYGYPYGPSAYFAYIDKWRASGTFDGLEFR
jgi:hypothetical protein